MATLTIYEMKTELKEQQATKKPVLTDELPDTSNLAVINGILCLTDTINNVVISVSDVNHELDKLTDIMFVKNGSSANAVFACLNFFEQLLEEFNENN